MFIHSADDTNLVRVLFAERIKLVGSIAGVHSAARIVSCFASEIEKGSLESVEEGISRGSSTERD